MTHKEKELVREFLTKIVEGDLSVVHTKRQGICANLFIYTNAATGFAITFSTTRFVCSNALDWKEHSGPEKSYFFPVRGIDMDTKWQGEQLRLRQSLCAHLLTKLEE